MCIPLKPLFSRHKGAGVQFTDEPTGALDTKSGDQVMELFKELNDDGVTIVMITHEPDIARCAKRIMYIRDGELHGEKAGEQE